MDEANRIADRIWILNRLFNIRELDSPNDARKLDVLPSRLMNELLPSGKAKGSTAFKSQEDFEVSLQKFYEMRGCDENGVPLSSTIKSLGLSQLVGNS